MSSKDKLVREALEALASAALSKFGTSEYCKLCNTGQRSPGLLEHQKGCPVPAALAALAALDEPDEGSPECEHDMRGMRPVCRLCHYQSPFFIDYGYELTEKEIAYAKTLKPTIDTPSDALDEPDEGPSAEAGDLANRLDRDGNHREECLVHYGVTCTCPIGGIASDVRALRRPQGLSEEDREFIHGAANLLERLGEDFDADGLRQIAGGEKQ